MIEILRRICREVALWAVMTLGSAILLVAASDTGLRSFAAGLLVTSASLLVTTTLFELAWQIVAGRGRHPNSRCPRPRS